MQSSATCRRAIRRYWGAINELKSNTHLGTLNDNIAEYLRKTNGVATTYFVWGNIGGLYPSWAWGTLLCSTDNTANFIGIANSDKTAAFAHYENGTWEKVPVESLSNLTTTNKSSLVGAINELNSKAIYDIYRNYSWKTSHSIDVSNANTLLLVAFGGTNGNQNIILPLTKTGTDAWLYNAESISKVKYTFSCKNNVITITNTATFLCFLIKVV